MKNILVAEDETAIRDFVVINLERAGYNVTEAENGAVAVEKYDNANGDFDIVILDVMMPEKDGLQVCKELRKKNNGLGIIMLSAKTQEMDKVSALMNGADDYVTKPFSPTELVARVDALYRRIAIAEMRSERITGILPLSIFWAPKSSVAYSAVLLAISSTENSFQSRPFLTKLPSFLMPPRLATAPAPAEAQFERAS